MTIPDVIKALEKKYPNRFISISQEWDYHTSYLHPREVEVKWNLYIQGFPRSFDYTSLDDMFSKLKEVINQ